MALGYLGFDSLSLRDFKTGIKYAEKIKDNDSRNYSLSLLYENITVRYGNKRFQSAKYADSTIFYLKKSLDKMELVKDGNKEISDDFKYDNIAFTNMRLGIFYLERSNKPGNIELAEKYLMRSLSIYNKYKPTGTNKIMLMNQLSWLYLEKKDYEKTINYAQLALDMEKKNRDVDCRVESYEFLTSAYSAINNKEKAKFYMDNYSFLKDSLSIAQKNNID